MKGEGITITASIFTFVSIVLIWYGSQGQEVWKGIFAEPATVKQVK